jgi:rare lipoprotein A
MLALSAVAAPASALAQSGGAGLPGSTSGGSGAPAPNSVSTETVSGGGITLSARSAALQNGTLWLSGTAAGTAGKSLTIERDSAGSWVPVATTTTHRGGAFQTAWRAGGSGNVSLRAAATGDSATTPAVTVFIYRSSIATEYGPGFYGHRTACGRVLKRQTVGVANRRLPCGSPVSIYYRGRTIVVPVIDRGPYANNANWDLTMATGKALGMDGTARIGALPTSG